MNVISGTLPSSDGIVLSYRHTTNNHGAVVVVAHGFYDSKDSTLSRKLEQGLVSDYDVFLFDFRGHGKSTGLFTWTSQEGADLEAVLKHLKSRYKKIGLIGFSMGGSIGMNVLAGSDEVDSFVCVSAPSDVSKIDYKLWELDPENEIIRKGKGVRPGPFWLDKQKPIDSVTKVRAPILYIHGTKDWLVKPWHSQALYDNTPGRKKIVSIEGGPHAEYLMLKYSGEFLTEIKNWFSETMGVPSAGTVTPGNKWKAFYADMFEKAAKTMGRIRGWFKHGHTAGRKS